jgi:hypothetical protein
MLAKRWRGRHGHGLLIFATNVGLAKTVNGIDPDKMDACLDTSIRRSE